MYIETATYNKGYKPAIGQDMKNVHTETQTAVSPNTKFVQHMKSEAGQTTAEYALVLLAAATIAMLVVAWAQNTSAIGDFFDKIFKEITGLI